MIVIHHTFPIGELRFLLGIGTCPKKVSLDATWHEDPDSTLEQIRKNLICIRDAGRLDWGTTVPINVTPDQILDRVKSFASCYKNPAPEEPKGIKQGASNQALKYE